MPELPDLRVLEEYVDATSLHRRIEDVMLRADLVSDPVPQRIRDGLRGAAFEETRRHGKHLFIRAGDRGWLHLHFGMTGDLVAYSTGEQPEHTELRVDFADGSHLACTSTRRFGEISWVEDVDRYVEDAGLGPDPLEDDLDAAALRERFSGRSGTLKGTLMTQEVVAGLGNLYVDEILFQAGLHPESETGHLDDADLEHLATTMHEVVEAAVAARADPGRLPDDWLLPHREPGEPCPRGDGTIERIEVSGRATYLCPGHQERR